MTCAPLVLFAYKRVDKLKECLKALENNIGVEKYTLYVFCDGPKNTEDILKVKEVREYLHEFEDKNVFKEMHIIKSDVNKGLATSVISGVSEVIKKYGKVIVLEDDIITTPDFLEYMNSALEYYKYLQQYGSVSAFTLPIKGLAKYEKDVYVTRKGECWGWATWKERWEKVDWNVSDFQEFIKKRSNRRNFSRIQYGIDKMLIAQMEGKIDSWAVRWCYHLFKEELLTVYPKVTKTKNIGFDGSGTHCGEGIDIYSVMTNENIKKCQFEELSVNYKLEKEVAMFERKAWVKAILKRNH